MGGESVTMHYVTVDPLISEENYVVFLISEKTYIHAFKITQLVSPRILVENRVKDVY